LYGLGLRGKRPIFSAASKPALGRTQLPIQWVPGAFAPEVKWLGLETDHSPVFSAEVTNGVKYRVNSTSSVGTDRHAHTNSMELSTTREATRC
jgi:hypothetical protein